MAGQPIGDMDAEYATTIADRAMRLMSQQSVPPTPTNFAVWFEYSLGNSLALRKDHRHPDRGQAQIRPGDQPRTLHHLCDARTPAADPLGDLPDQLSGLIATAQPIPATPPSATTATTSRRSARCRPKPPEPAIPARSSRSWSIELSKATARAATAWRPISPPPRKNWTTSATRLKAAEQRSNTDALTGLANRHSMDEFLRLAQIAAMEKDEALSVFLIDIDHFKKFNDDYGHQVGDQVIQAGGQGPAGRCSRSRSRSPLRRRGIDRGSSGRRSRRLAHRWPSAFAAALPKRSRRAAQRARKSAASRFRSGWRNSASPNPRTP